MRGTFVSLIVWILVSLGAGLIGSRFLPGEWYASLAKPTWTPPSYVFAPVWTVLYVSMGVAAGLVWRKAGFRGAAAGLSLFVLQLVLNAVWSYLFFGVHSPMHAFIDIMALWMLILLTILEFSRIVPAAGVLMLPYLCWVSFALALNLAIWRLNG
jgi:benzodiazapine receptor